MSSTIRPPTPGYNRDAAEVARDGVGRLAASVKNYGPVCGARMLRVLPAFGIGGIGNRVLRSRVRAAVVRRHEGEGGSKRC